jgi:hypothetical protein
VKEFEKKMKGQKETFQKSISYAFTRKDDEKDYGSPFSAGDASGNSALQLLDFPIIESEEIKHLFSKITTMA